LKRVLFFFVAILLLFNCSQILRKKPLTTDRITIQEICNRIDQNFQKLETLKGRAHLSVEMPGMGFTAISHIALKTPDSLAINVKAGFGMGVGSIFVSKDQFMVYSSMENRVYLGNVESFDMSQFFQINVKFQDLIELISGILLIDDLQNTALSIDENKFLITNKTELGTAKYWIDPDKFVVTDFQYYNNEDEVIVKQEFRSFQKEKGVFLPKIIKINRPKTAERITLMYTSRQTNKKLAAEEFLIKMPENTQQINL